MNRVTANTYYNTTGAIASAGTLHSAGTPAAINSSGFTTIAIPVTMPSQATLTATGSFGFIISADKSGAAEAIGDGMIIGQLQFELGTVATPFEARPLGLETELCKRYLPWVDLTTYIVGGICTSTAAAWATLPLSVPSRVAPTGYTSAITVNFTTANGAPVGAANFYAATTSNVTLQNGGLAGLVTGNSTMLTAVSPTRLLFTGCEL